MCMTEEMESTTEEVKPAEHSDSEDQRAKLEGMRQKLAIMKWDVERDQINPAQRVKYNKLKEEFEKLKTELKVD
jgi:hypothetical protein